MFKSVRKYLCFSLVLGMGKNIPDPVCVGFTSFSVFLYLAVMSVEMSPGFKPFTEKKNFPWVFGV